MSKYESMSELLMDSYMAEMDEARAEAEANGEEWTDEERYDGLTVEERNK